MVVVVILLHLLFPLLVEVDLVLQQLLSLLKVLSPVFLSIQMELDILLNHLLQLLVVVEQVLLLLLR